MSEQMPPTPPEREKPPSGGVNIGGSGNVTVGGDVAGGDIVKTTTQVGFSAAAVQRLLLIVGGLVFVTAACFFGGGLLVGGAIVAALNRPVEVSPEAASSMQTKINRLQAVEPGAPFHETFTEVELNSYWELVAGPQMGLTPGTGAARVLGNNRVVLSGKFASLGNFKVLAVVEPRVNTPGRLFQVDSAAIQLVPLGDTSLGWLPAPASAAQPVVDRVDKLFGSNVEFTGTSVSGPTLTVNGLGH